MVSAKEHYDRLLARHYSWMAGVPFDEKVDEQAMLLTELGVSRPDIAIDLGAGSGFQTIALAKLGARKVHAVDLSEALLDELAREAGDRDILTHNIDLMAFRDVVPDPVDTILCMGDTLTHLERREDVSRLFALVRAALLPGGQFILSWRDMTLPPEGLDRFIPVRATDDKIMTCFLEDCGDRIMTHDLIYTRTGEGWSFQKSAYPKLKLPSAEIRQELASLGFTVRGEMVLRGMTFILARI